MRTLIIFAGLLALILISPAVNAQKIPREEKKKIKKADQAFERADYLKSFHMYRDILKSDPANTMAAFKAGLSLYNINKSDTASIAYFNTSKNAIPESHFYLGRVYHLKGEPSRALEEYFQFSSVNKKDKITAAEVEEQVKKSETAIRQESEKEFYVVKNAGKNINTIYPEYVPLVWNEQLIFTSRRPASLESPVDPYGKYYEDIYIARKKQDGWLSEGEWEKPVPISPLLNSPTHDACVALSPRGDEMIIYRTDETQLSGDLYLTRHDSGGWSAPVKMGPEINSPALEASACYSGYGNKIVFSSNRDGGYGGKDLYRTVRFLNGTYSRPVNLGPAINTSEDEDAPFIDKNSNILYFSSKGHGGMGEYDIFKADFDLDSNNWVRPTNMGPPVNSVNDDIYFFRHNDQEAYFSSRREGGIGDMDIYKVNFSQTTRLIVYCKFASDAPAGQLKDIQLSLYDANTGELKGLYNPNMDYMKTILLVTKGDIYEMRIEGENIETVEQKVTFTDKDKEVLIELKEKR